MFAECAAFGSWFSYVKAVDPVVIASVFLSKQDREALEVQARTIARQFGISECRWLKWRAGYGPSRDLLMIIDPEREAERINEKEEGPAARGGRALSKIDVD